LAVPGAPHHGTIAAGKADAALQQRRLHGSFHRKQHLGGPAARTPCGHQQQDSFDSNWADLHMSILTRIAGNSKNDYV
jgi:hypothetical protein